MYLGSAIHPARASDRTSPYRVSERPCPVQNGHEETSGCLVGGVEILNHPQETQPVEAREFGLNICPGRPRSFLAPWHMGSVYSSANALLSFREYSPARPSNASRRWLPGWIRLDR